VRVSAGEVYEALDAKLNRPVAIKLLKGGAFRTLVDLQDMEPGEGLSVSPDGEWLLFVVMTRTSDLVLVENFRS